MTLKHTTTRKGEERGERRGNQKGEYIQQSQLKVTMDLGLQRDLNIQVQVQPQPQRVGLAATTATTTLLLLVHSIVGYAAKGVGDAALQALRRLSDAAQAGLIQRPSLLAPLHLVVLLPVPAVGSLRGLVLFLRLRPRALRLLVGGLLLLLLLLLARGALLRGRHLGLMVLSFSRCRLLGLIMRLCEED